LNFSFYVIKDIYNENDMEGCKMTVYTVILKINGKYVQKKVRADDKDSAVKRAVRESSWFGGKVEVISVVKEE